jgi:hypothetical protein
MKRMQKCGPRTGCLLEEVAKVWSKNWLLDEKGVAAGVTSRKRI